jgi:6-phosphogluconolactonase
MTVTKTEANVHSVLTDPSARWAYAPCAGGDAVMMFHFNPTTGSLSPNSPAFVATAPHARPRHLNFHPSLPILYVLTEEAATVNVYAIDEFSGRLSELQSVSIVPATFSGKPHTADLHVTPNGQFLFASERKTSILTGFAIDAASGMLSLIGYFETETEPRSFAIDPSGAFLLSVGIASHRMSVHAIAPGTGVLDRISDVPVGKGPNWIEIIE